MDGTARDGDIVALRPSGGREARGPDRPRPSRAAYPAQLRWQEHSDLEERESAGAAGPLGGRRQAQAARPGDDLLDGGIVQGIGASRVNSIVLRGARVIDPASDLDGRFD